MARFVVKEKELYFFKPFVLPKKQGQGKAKQLVKAFEDHAGRLGCRRFRAKYAWLSLKTAPFMKPLASSFTKNTMSISQTVRSCKSLQWKRS